MSNPFGTEDIAAGYATWRPPVHPRVTERVHRSLQKTVPVACALNVGCEDRISIKALNGLAHRCIGMDSAEAMLGWTSTISAQADFLPGSAASI